MLGASYLYSSTKKVFLDGKIKEDEMGKAYSIYRRDPFRIS
jgi:hypothetical protein